MHCILIPRPNIIRNLNYVETAEMDRTCNMDGTIQKCILNILVEKPEGGKRYYRRMEKVT